MGGNVCRIYVEREGMSVKLYVTKIASGDRGDYKCHRMVGGSSRERKVITLVVFSEWDEIIFSISFDQRRRTGSGAVVRPGSFADFARHRYINKVAP